MRTSHLFCAVLLAVPATAQLQPGTFLATTNGAVANRGVFIVDRFANTSTRMTIQGITWSGVGPVRTLVEDNKNFLLAVLSNGGWVYRVTWSGSAWRAKLLNTVVMASKELIWEIARIGNDIYAVTSTGPNTTTTGKLWRFPAAGGAPTVVDAFGTRFPGPPSSMVAVGTDLHIFTWRAPGPARGAHLVVDTTAKAPAAQQRGQLLPYSKAFAPCRALCILPRQACVDPLTGAIVIIGRTGDVLYRTTAGVDLQQVPYYDGVFPCAPGRTLWGNAIAINSDTGAVLVGDANNGFEEQICRASSFRNQVQILPVTAGTPINGLTYVPSGSLYREIATQTGCKQGNGKIACSYVNSLPRAGNSNFTMTLETTSPTAMLFVGNRQMAVDLTALGAPGCMLGTPLIVPIPGRRTLTGHTVKIGLPASLPTGLRVYTQWLLLSKVNPLGLVTSATRLVKP